MAGPARFRARHFGLLLSFLLLVVGPASATAYYLFAIAKDQYASNIGFSVQREDGGATLDLLGGLSQITGGSTPDPVILYRYITSRDMILAVEKKVDMKSAYYRPDDPFYSLAEDAPIEEREAHWQRMTKVFLDSGSGLIEIRVRAFTPEDAQAISAAIRDESDRMLNQLSFTAQEDATSFAHSELDKATERLRLAQGAMTEFRVRTKIVDPATDFAGRMGLLNSLLAKQAEAVIELDLLKASSEFEGDPRLEKVEKRIEVIGKRIKAERARIGTADDGSGDGYAELVSQFENLRLESEFAQRAYVAALANLDIAVGKAQRNSRYLAIYMPPTLAEKSQFPQRWTWSLMIAGMALVIWSIMVMTFYAVRDRQ